MPTTTSIRDYDFTEIIRKVRHIVLVNKPCKRIVLSEYIQLAVYSELRAFSVDEQIEMAGIILSIAAPDFHVAKATKYVNIDTGELSDVHSMVIY